MNRPLVTPVPSLELAHMLLCSFRYSLGRKTYITSICEEWLQTYWKVIPAAWQRQILDDIRTAIANGVAGHDCDIASWKSVLELPINEEANAGSSV